MMTRIYKYLTLCCVPIIRFMLAFDNVKVPLAHALSETRTTDKRANVMQVCLFTYKNIVDLDTTNT